jgi:hypothetical protein
VTYAQLLARYREKHGALLRPASLQPSLHLAYSMGIKRSFTDLGTYNPKSTLPGGGKSDHAYYPAWAFDLGRPGWRGLWGSGTSLRSGSPSCTRRTRTPSGSST